MAAQESPAAEGHWVREAGISYSLLLRLSTSILNHGLADIYSNDLHILY